MTLAQLENETMKIERGRDFTIEYRIHSREWVRLRDAAAASDTALTVEPLEYALAAGDKLLFGKNTVVTVDTGGAAAGAVSVPVTSLAVPLANGSIGSKLADLTVYTLEWELLVNPEDTTPVIANSAVTVTILTQTGADRGKVQVVGEPADTTSLELGSYFGALWRTNTGNKRPLAYGPVELVAAGQQ